MKFYLIFIWHICGLFIFLESLNITRMEGLFSEASLARVKAI